jgi:uncharacterized membrane protein YkoI
MMPRFMLAVFILLATLSQAGADQHEVSPARARAAVMAGQIKPLATLLSEIEARYSGQVIEAELQEAGGRWSYEFEMLPADGKLFVVILDATTGALLRTRGPVRERR